MQKNLTDVLPVEHELLAATHLPNGTLVDKNKAWQTIFGTSRSPWARLSDNEQGIAATFIKEASEGSLVTNQLFLVQMPKRAEPLPVLLNFLPIRLPEGDNSAICGVMITGEVLAEPSSWMTSQTQRHRMEHLGRMTMGIAHDFNNLLSGILGHTELLKRAAGTPIPSAIEEHLHTIEQAALDGAALVRKIQQYLRQEQQTSFEPVDLTDLIADAVTLTRPYWYNEPRRQGISIETRLQLEAVPPIMGAASELRDVFVNLILNAVQAMPHGGVITFATQVDPQSGVLVQVSDTGTGMTDRVRARIFEPLFTTKGKRGTGMGLAVCYGIVQEHDGDIDVETQLGFGTTFTLAFPPVEGEVSSASSGEPEQAGRSANILVVDDQDTVRDVITRLLQLKGHTVLGASSGAHALQLAEARDFDIVFTDQGMPEMNGRQLAARLRAHNSHMPIVLLTGDTEIGETDEAVTHILSKPFKVDVLEATIQRLVFEQGN